MAVTTADTVEIMTDMMGMTVRMKADWVTPSLARFTGPGIAVSDRADMAGCTAGRLIRTKAWSVTTA
jgi:hypothetical protein